MGTSQYIARARVSSGQNLASFFLVAETHRINAASAASQSIFFADLRKRTARNRKNEKK
jgi:hypothetical protein